MVAIVGYTNAGKTTLFNKLTESNQLAEDQLFATLDSVTRKNKNPIHGPVLFSDTVGFISELPTQLIESFKATLDELKSADMLLHVVDISDLSNPSLIKSYEFEHPLGLGVDENTLFLCDDRITAGVAEHV